jgi:transposase
MGLFMDNKGIPISYRLFSGNQTDPVTYIPAIEQVKKQFGIERIVVVADKAMNSKKNVLANLDYDYGWIFSQKHRGKRGSDKSIQEFILSKEGWEYNEKMTFAKKSMVRERKLKKGSSVPEKVVVTWNEKYARREKIRREGAVEYAENLTNAERYRASCKRGGKRYIELSVLNDETGELEKLSPFLGIDQEAIDFDAQFDGINVLVTSEVNMKDEEVISHYHELSEIEDCFRVTKTEFNSRPVFVRLKKHIEAHFLTCFIALVILRIIQVKIERKMSAGEIITALKSAKANELTKGYHRVQADKLLIKLNKFLGIEWNQAYVKTEQIEQFSRNWLSTKK